MVLDCFGHRNDCEVAREFCSGCSDGQFLCNRLLDLKRLFLGTSNDRFGGTILLEACNCVGQVSTDSFVLLVLNPSDGVQIILQ